MPYERHDEKSQCSNIAGLFVCFVVVGFCLFAFFVWFCALFHVFVFVFFFSSFFFLRGRGGG